MQVLRKAFSQPLHNDVAKLVACCEDDAHIIDSDIAGSLAHCAMLEQTGLITSAQADNIKQGLQQLRVAYASGQMQLTDAREDVHMNVEAELKTLIGEDAMRLHTARSRNDQVALDMRLFTRTQVQKLTAAITELQMALLTTATKHINVVMPGYTHLQRAQPILLAHGLHAFVEMLERDCGRLQDCDARAAVSPSGAAALAGTSLPVNPAISAVAVGFAHHFANSVDAVSDRDFLVELVSACALCAVHLSQLAETMLIWNTAEFHFITFGDDVTTASSLMPNKKNPDPLEIIRSIAPAATGDLVTVLTILKGLPLGYNRDLQSTKQPAIHCTAQLLDALNAMTAVVESMEVDQKAMLAGASDPFLAATDLVDALVKEGVPFRQAHETVSELVTWCRREGRLPSSCTAEELMQYLPSVIKDTSGLFDPHMLVDLKISPGGTATVQVQAAIQKSKERIVKRLDAE